MNMTGGVSRHYHKGPDKIVTWTCRVLSTCPETARAYSRGPAPKCPVHQLSMRHSS